MGARYKRGQALPERTSGPSEQWTIRTSVTYAEWELIGQDIEPFQGLFIGRRQSFFDDFGGAGVLDNFSGRQCCQC